jgi:hypothetical protein
MNLYLLIDALTPNEQLVPHKIHCISFFSAFLMILPEAEASCLTLSSVTGLTGAPPSGGEQNIGGYNTV